MEQIVDLQGSREFQALDVELVSISPDPPDSWRQVMGDLGIRPPVLTDAGNEVATDYGVMRWRMPPDAPIGSAEPGHTFVLVDSEGRVAWVQDYGAAQNGGLMYVEPRRLVRPIRARLAKGSGR
jgi:peroxiredoxin